MPEAERREVYEDVVFNLAKKEKEENKAMRKRNMKVCAHCLDVCIIYLVVTCRKSYASEDYLDIAT